MLKNPILLHEESRLDFPRNYSVRASGHEYNLNLFNAELTSPNLSGEK